MSEQIVERRSASRTAVARQCESQHATRLYIDNSGAVELSRDRRSCHRSRHIDRRYFKVRELQYAEELVTVKIPTALNSSDVLTKSLDNATFHRHRARMLNLPGNTPVEAGAATTCKPCRP